MNTPKILLFYLAFLSLFLSIVGFAIAQQTPAIRTVYDPPPPTMPIKTSGPPAVTITNKVYGISNPDNQIKIIISAIGDCTLGQDESFGQNGTFNDEFRKQKWNYQYFFSGVQQILASDDLTIANLETTFTTATAKAQKQFRFKGSPQYVNILKAGSIETVNLANNHTLDYLQKGFNDTVTNLKQAKIGYFGAGYTQISEVKGIKIGLLGYKGWSNQIKQQIKKDLANMKKNTDMVIVTFHWGDEGSYKPNSLQKDLGHLAIDNGASLVIGHHPHVVQEVEDYKGKDIVYSLGNFCFGGNRNPPDKDSFIFQQSFLFNQNHNLSSVGEKTIIPCSVSSVRYRNDYRPVKLTEKEKSRVLAKIANQTPLKGTSYRTKRQ